MVIKKTALTIGYDSHLHHGLLVSGRQLDEELSRFKGPPPQYMSFDPRLEMSRKCDLSRSNPLPNSSSFDIPAVSLTRARSLHANEPNGTSPYLEVRSMQQPCIGCTDGALAHFQL